MKPNERFLKQDKEFWAHVRTISQKIGYTDRSTAQIKVPTIALVKEAMALLELSTSYILDTNTDQPTSVGATMLDYFQYRADILNTYVEPRLMCLEEARATFQDMRSRLNPSCPLPMNKQKGEKKDFAFFTGIINMLIEQEIGDLSCDYDPHELTAVTSPNRTPLRTLAR